MNILKKAMVIGVSVVVAAGIAACNKPGPAETAGKKIDEVTEKAGEKIGAATEKLGAEGEKVGEVVSDSAITAKVKAALLAEPGLKSLEISVDTMQGKVVLSGSVDSQLAIDKAKEVASSVAGVTAVDNELTLTSAKK